MLKIIFLAALLAACSSSTSEAQTATSGQEVCSGGCAVVKLIALEDGTRCAAMVGVQKAALSCDWEGNRK